MDTKRGSRIYGLLLLFCIGLSVVITNPLGEFSLNDDWFYYLAVQNFQWSSFKLDSLITPSLMGQIFYGHGLASVFGFSFTLLRLSTIGLGIIGTLFLYRLLIKIGQARSSALLFSLVLWFNPIFFFLNFSFMTDVPALVFVMIATYFFWRWHQSDRLWFLVLALMFALYSCLIRQSYVFVLLTTALLVFWPAVGKKRDWRAVGIYSLSLAMAFGAKLWLTALGWWPTKDVSLHSFESFGGAIWNLVQQTYFVWHYLGLFLLPVTVLIFVGLNSRRRFWGIASGLLAATLALFLCYFYGLAFPYFGNILSAYGLGPRQPNLTLSGSPELALMPIAAWLLTMVVGFVAGVGAYSLVARIRQMMLINEVDPNRRFKVFLLINLICQFAVVAMFIGFDRYYLSVLFFALVWLALVIRQEKVPVVSWLLLLPFVFVSVIGTHDYLRESALKWRIADQLVASGSQVSEVDGGYEWLGWHWYKKGRPDYLPFYDPTMPWYITSLMPDHRRDYVISYDAVSSGYQLVDIYSYPRVFGEGKLYLLKRQ